MKLARFIPSSETTVRALALLSPFALTLLNASIASAQTPPPPVVVDTSAIDEAICWLVFFQQGSYGALLMAVSGMGAVVGAALGQYRTAINCLVVAIGTWLIQPIAQLMFSYWPTNCTQLMQMPTGMPS